MAWQLQEVPMSSIRNKFAPLLLLLPAACGDEIISAHAKVSIDPAVLRMFAPLPESVPHADGPATRAQIELGQMLFFEERLSKSEQISCNSCHALDNFGVDGQRFSTGHSGKKGSRNSPSVYNAAGNRTQFWDGRAADLEEQAKGPILNPDEMGMPDAEAVIEVLQGIPGYAEAFGAAFPGEENSLTFDNLARAIGAFERQLITPSRWDAFLNGDDLAIDDLEKHGFNTFVEVGCVTCHSGAFVGGRMFQKAGLFKAWPNQEDRGRGAVTGKASDEMFFKVPSLRNVAKTGPYFHDGSAETLDRAIEIMGEHQLGRKLDTAQRDAISAWLRSLTGEIPEPFLSDRK